MITRMLIQGLAAAAIIAALAGGYQAGGSGFPILATAHHED